MVKKTGWYLVDLLCDGETITVIRSHIDAVFAMTSREAIGMAAERNPRRPGEIFGVMLATCEAEKRRAIRRHEQRNHQIAEMYEIAERL